MDYYTIETDDGYRITDIPKEMKPNDPRIKARYQQMKSQGVKRDSFAGVNPGAMDPAAASRNRPGAVQGRIQGTPQQPTPGQPIPGAFIPGNESGASFDDATSNFSPPTQPRPATPLPAGVQTAANMAGGVVRGAGPVAMGALAGGMVGGPPGALAGAGAVGAAQFVGDPLITTINKLFGTNYATPTEAMERFFDFVGVEKPKSEAEKFVQTVSSVMSGTAAQIGLGKALQLGTGLSQSTRQLVGKALESGPLQQLLGDVGSVSAAKAAEMAGAGPVGQLAASGAGSLLGSTAGNAMNLRPAGVNPAQGAVDVSKRFRTELMTSDVFKPETKAQQAAQLVNENIPFIGTGPVRAQQQKNRIEDVKDIIRRFGGDSKVDASNDLMFDLINKRADNFKRWENMKDQALETVATTSPNARVSMPRTVAKIDESLAKLKSLNNDEVTPGINKLLNAKKSFENQTAENVLINKRILGKVFESDEVSAVKNVIDKELKDTYEAVRLDLTDFMETAGNKQAKDKWMIANKEEVKLFDEVKLPILKTTLEKGVVRPEVVKNMLFNNDRSVIESLNKNLSAKGRESAKTAIMQEVARKVGEDASPDKFLTEMRKLRSGSDPIGMFFTGDDLKVVEGLTDVLKLSDRASKFAVNTPTGQQLYFPVGVATGAGMFGYLKDFFGGGGTGAALAAGTGLTAMGIAGAAARAYESPKVRNLLMAIPRVKSGSKEKLALMNRLVDVIKTEQSKEQE